MNLRILGIAYNLLVFLIIIMGMCWQTGFVTPPVAQGTILACVGLITAIWVVTIPRYRDYIFEPVRDEELSQKVVAAWDEYGIELEKLGFRRVGNYRLQKAPMATDVRYYLCDDPRVRCEASDIDGELGWNFCTVFEDGRLIESGIHPTVETRCKPDEQLWFITQQSGTLAGVFQRHMQVIDDYERETEVAAIKLGPERLYEVAQYGHRLVWWSHNQSPRHLGSPEPLRPNAGQHYASAS